MKRLMLAACMALPLFAAAEPLVPTDDAQVLEILPAAGAARADERRLRRTLARQPLDAQAAVTLARGQLALAHDAGDPRPAGQALAVLQRFGPADTAPPAVVLLRATVLQYLHEFDDAIAQLGRLVQREPRNAQAWLVLATLHRVQGRYTASDAACEGVAAAGASLHAQACRAENDALRGQVDGAVARLQRLAATPRLDGATRNWLLTTVAEAQWRAGRPQAAEVAFAAALRAAPEAYTTLAYADWLIEQDRDAQALALLDALPRNDAVLLRRAIAGARVRAASAEADARELRERIAAANQRPQAQRFHAREQAMAALLLDGDPGRALALARLNLERQREPLDLLVMARAARAARDRDAQREVDALRASIGLHDPRLPALL